MTRNVARMGVFIALAMVFSYVEALIPFDFGIPGVKLGIANLVIVTGLYLFSAKETFGISMIRILMMGMLFGNGVSIFYSFAGGILSFFIMLIAKKIDWFSIIGVSIAGGVFHNVGQILAAILVLKNVMIITYLPVLLISGIVTGALMGILANRIIALKNGDKDED